MEIRHLRYFLAVAKRGEYDKGSRAAACFAADTLKDS